MIEDRILKNILYKDSYDVIFIIGTTLNRKLFSLITENLTKKNNWIIFLNSSKDSKVNLDFGSVFNRSIYLNFDYIEKIYDELSEKMMDIEENDENIFNTQGNLDNDEVEGEITESDCWKVISAYFSQHGLVSQQLSSFNQFVSRNIQEIVDENGLLKIETDKNYRKDAEQITYELNFKQVKIARAPQFSESNAAINRTLFPNEARVRNLDYLSDLSVDVSFREKKNNSQDKNEEKVKTQTYSIGKIPIMVRSDYCSLYNKSDTERVDVRECEFDQGGYFIIGGGEKVIVAQERMATNFVYVFNKKDQSGFSWQAEVRSSLDGSNRPPIQFAVKIAKKNTHMKHDLGGLITARIPYVKSDVDIVILFRALGLESDKDIIDFIVFDENDNTFKELLRPSLEKFFADDMNKDECLEYIGNRTTRGEVKEQETRIRRAEEILRKEMLSHVSIERGSESKKAYFIGYMIYRLGNCALGRAKGDDRDHYGKKRLDMSGVLLTGIFRQYFRNFLRNAESNLKERLKGNNSNTIKLEEVFDTNIISNGMKYALATGNWGKNRIGVVLKTGVAQVLQRLTFMSSLSHLRRLNTPLEKTGKITKPRQLHNTHWGMLCPAETPEGQACGLVKNLSLMTFVSVGTSSKTIKEILDNYPEFQKLSEVNPSNIRGKSKIFINGSWLGISEKPEKIMTGLISQRRRGIILSRHIRKQSANILEVRRSDNADFSLSFSRNVYYIISVSWEDENGTQQADVNVYHYRDAKRCRKKGTAFIGIFDENLPKLPKVLNEDLFYGRWIFQQDAGAVVLWNEYEEQKNTTDIFCVMLFFWMIGMGIVFFANLANIIAG